MKRLSKAATVILWSVGIICVLGMASVGLLEIRNALCEVKNDVITAVETMRDEGQELKYTLKDELADLKDTIKSYK
ncbi:hypothetical protein [Enterococcus sp. BWR-S5]|uniref:hypothetical protein n=1 Tax=Enterococcus sp. BWR-S5 TaxID=2787714 RepID=UPI001920A7DF|nr:hypothetical protein [Enterococcus sp. BWR-S5]MBL1225854.1 hypothetical protein [Enterococcus sp. BWR-S5]